LVWSACEPKSKIKNHYDSQQARKDKSFITKHSKQKAFFKGSNSSVRHHLRAHFEVYKKGCLDAKVPLHHYAIPCKVWMAIMAPTEKGKKKQEMLDNVVRKGERPKEFSRDGVLCAVA